MLAIHGLVCDNTGRKHTPLPMIRRTFSGADLGYTAAMVLTLAGIIALGLDNSHQLARCEASGRSQAECRLLVLGR